MTTQTPSKMPDHVGKPKLSWISLGIILLAIWLLFLGGLEEIVRTGSTVRLGAERVATTVGVAEMLPTAAVIVTAHGVVFATREPSGIVAEAVIATRIPANVVATTVVPLPAGCVVITWHDGSQGCTNGAEIDSIHSQAGYCVIVQGRCDNGQATGLIEQIDPEIAAEPTPTPWPAKVADTHDITWSGWQEADGTSCVAVQFADKHRQQNCGPKGVKYPAATLEFIARMIIDGRLGPGGFPKG